jgi:polysaccharide biosynthesis transport protein
MAFTPSANTHQGQDSVLQEAAGGLVNLGKAVRKHWTLVCAALLLSGGAALLYTKSQPRIYEAASMVEMNSHITQPLGNKDDSLDIGSGFFFDSREYYETQYKIIASDRVLSAAARDLGLANDGDFMGYSATPQSPPSLESATSVLRRHVIVEPVKYSRLVLIKVEDTRPKRAKRICDAVAAAYVDQNLQNSLTATSDAVAWLNGQVDNVKQELEHDEDALHEFKQRNDLPSTSINEASNMLRVELQEFDLALAHTRTKRQEIEAREAELSKVSSDNPDQLPASELLSSPFLGGIRQHYEEAVKGRLSLLAEGKGESHPLVKQLDETIAATKATLLGEVRNIQGAVQRDLAIVIREEAGEEGLYREARRRAVDLNMKEIEYHRLDRSRDENEKLYGMLLEHTKQADLARMMRVNNLRIIDPASEPHVPIRPRVLVELGVGLFIGLVLGIASAWIREQLDTSLKTPEDIEGKLGVTFLGLLPELRDVERRPYGSSRRRRRMRAKALDAGAIAPELIVHARPLSGIAEAARSIRTNLLFMNPDHPHRTLLVTSAAPSEGKTTVACTLAIAFAQGGQRVCIVDCDLRRPRLHRIFERAGDAGVTNVLVGEATIDDVAKPTQVNNLWSIPSGPTPPNPADILQSARCRKFIADLAERFDRIVIDSPPAVAVTDSAIISTLCDGTVFVALAFKTSKHLSIHGLRALRDVDAPILGAVLNAVDLNRHEYNNYYHYYYYKREGYLAPPEPKQGDEGPSAHPSN